MNQDNGNILMKLIYLCMDHLMHNPKRAIIILFAVFIVTMITGELIGTVRNSEMVFSSTAMPIVLERSEDYFILPEINDHGAVYLTPHAEITETPTPDVLIVKTQTPTPTEAQSVSCMSDMNISAGNMAVIDFPGEYSAEIKVRYRPEDPNIITGIVRSGDKVYILDGPVCLSGFVWFKINSDAQKIIGWIPEKIASKLIIKKDPVSVNIP